MTTKWTVWPDSFAGPAEIAVAQPGKLTAPALSFAETSGPFVNDGASFTGVTLMVNVCGADVSLPPFAMPPLSCAVTVTVALPKASAAGV